VRTRSIGSLVVSEIGIGCNNFGGRLDASGTRAVVDAAIDVGITLFDTADIYGGTQSEVLLGRALGSRRDDVVVATKFGMPVDAERSGAKPEYIVRALEDSLRRLDTDRVDLYQLHAPDQSTPIGETLAALDEIVRQGKVREIGCSNFTAAQLREAEAATGAGAARFVSVQNQYSLLYREPELEVLPECERAGLVFLPYYPLASGLLSGKYRGGGAPPANSRMAAYPAERWDFWMNERNTSAIEALVAFAESQGHTVLELAFAWLLSRPEVSSVIAGAMSPQQVAANAAAASWVLDDTDIAAIDDLVPPEPTGR
jgi:aryl-alcohol dehydrogenase-like predicted oxidoreductase